MIFRNKLTSPYKIIKQKSSQMQEFKSYISTYNDDIINTIFINKMYEIVPKPRMKK